MKRYIAVICVISCCVILFSACGKSKQAKYCDQLISAIGVVTINSGSAIEDAETAYASLTEAQKEDVENHLALVQARKNYNVLVQKLIDEKKKIAEKTQRETALYSVPDEYYEAAIAGLKELYNCCVNPDSLKIFGICYNKKSDKIYYYYSASNSFGGVIKDYCAYYIKDGLLQAEYSEETGYTLNENNSISVNYVIR